MSSTFNDSHGLKMRLSIFVQNLHMPLSSTMEETLWHRLNLGYCIMIGHKRSNYSCSDCSELYAKLGCIEQAIGMKSYETLVEKLKYFLYFLHPAREVQDIQF